MILITGCAGMLGNNFARYLLGEGYSIVGIDNLSGSYEEYIPQHKNFRFIKADLCDFEFEDLNEKIDTIFHFAAYAAEGLSPFIRKFNYQNNVIASANVINFCIKNDCKLIFTSSMAVMGNQLPPFKETQNPNPIDPYGIAKYAVEMDIKQAAEQFGLKYNIIRPHNIIGKYQNIWDRYRNVAGIFINRGLNNKDILIYGDGNQKRAFSDVKYYMEPFEKLIKSFDGETFNLGADKEYSINELFEIVKRTLGKDRKIVRSKNCEPRHEAKNAWCDHSKAKKMLSFIDKTKLEDTVQELYEWAKNQPSRKSEKFEYEVEKGIYEYWK